MYLFAAQLEESNIQLIEKQAKQRRKPSETGSLIYKMNFDQKQEKVPMNLLEKLSTNEKR
jgi:hypothetical protein